MFCVYIHLWPIYWLSLVCKLEWMNEWMNGSDKLEIITKEAVTA
jgi:hypothetical protein